MNRGGAGKRNSARGFSSSERAAFTGSSSKRARGGGGGGGGGGSRGGGGHGHRPKKQKKPKADRTNYSKKVRKAIEHDGDVPGAYELFLAARDAHDAVPFNHNPGPMLKTDAFHVLILGLMRATHVDHAVHVAKAMRETGAPMPLKLLSQMIASLPCRVSGAVAVELVNALGPVVSGLDAHSRGYVNTYYRLLAMEFCEESASYLSRIRSAPGDAMERGGSAMLDLHASVNGKKAGEIFLRGPREYPALRPEEGRRVMGKNDSVLISRLKKWTESTNRGLGGGGGAYGSSGGLSGMGRGGSAADLRAPAPGSAEAAEAAASAAAVVANGDADASREEMIEYEGEIVSTELDNRGLRVKIIGGGHKDISGGGWRVDKLANRVTFRRQVEAIRALLNVDTHCAANPKNAEKSSLTDPCFRQILTAGFDVLAKADYVQKAAAARQREYDDSDSDSGEMSDGGDRGGGDYRDYREGDDHEIYEAFGAISAADVPLACDERASGLIPDRAEKFAKDFASGAVDPIAKSLNESQRNALRSALTNRLTLVQGPPGTGKTYTSVAIVKGLLAMNRGPVLCTSDSNTAVDNLVQGMSDARMRVVRVGRSEAVRPELLKYVLERMFNDRTGPERSLAQQRALRQADVVCCTCSGAGSDMLEKFNFSAVLLDEASQVTEPSSLVPLSKGCHQLVLVGDHKQLPPTVTCRDAGNAGLSTSLFDRLANMGVKPKLLDVQFRMHPALSRFPSDAFYDGRVKSGTLARDRPAPSGFAWPNAGVPIAFVPVGVPGVSGAYGGHERREGNGSFVNQREADVVVDVLSRLLRAGGGELEPRDVGVVTPYAAQVRHIRRQLRNRGIQTGIDRETGKPGVEVSSVDGYQGREKEVMVVSTVRSNDRGTMGFVSDARRCNVTLTRAKRGVVVCGDPNTLASDHVTWGRWLRWAAAGGLVIGAPGDPAEVMKLRTMDADFAGPQPAAAGRGPAPTAAQSLRSSRSRLQ